MIDQLNEELKNAKKKMVKLENINDELQEKLRSIESSLENAVLQLDRTNEELIIFKTEVSFGQSPKNGLDSPTEIIKRDVEVQTEEINRFDMPFQSPFGQKRSSVDISGKKPITKKDFSSPTASLWNDLLSSPPTVSHKRVFRNVDFDMLISNKVGKEIYVGGSSPNLHKQKYTHPGSPTPLKVFLNEHLTKIQKLKTTNSRFEMKSRLNSSVSKTSMRSSRAPSGGQTLANSRLSDSKDYSALYNQIIGNKNGLLKSRKKNSARLVQINNGHVTPAQPNQTDFSQHFLENKAKLFTSSIEMPGENFNSRLTNLHDKSKHKFRMINGNTEDISIKKDSFEIFRERLKKIPTAGENSLKIN